MTALTTTTAAQLAPISLDPFAGFDLLTKYDDAPPPRPDFLACISAGYKGENGAPVVSRDGTIHVSDPQGRALGLAEALAAMGGKTLIITLPSDNPKDFFFQHYRKEGRSRLEAHGDAKGITTIGTGGAREYHPVGSTEFERLRAECKVTYEIAFYLARWVETDGYPRPEIYWPDGVGAYRIRSTSQKTANNFMACVRELSARTGGPVAGFPLEVRLVYPQVADPTGVKRQVPLFSFILKPPGGFSMDAGAFRQIARESASILPSMQLVALPPAPGVDEAIADFEAELLTVPLDAAECRKGFFGITGKTRWGTDDGRAELIGKFTKGKTTSLKAFLETASEDDMRALLEAAEAAVAGVDLETGEVTEPPTAVEPEVITVEAEVIEMASKAQITAAGEQMKRVGYTPAQGRDWLKTQFGKSTRAELTGSEIEAFIEYLAGLASVSLEEEEGDA